MCISGLALSDPVLADLTGYVPAAARWSSDLSNDYAGAVYRVTYGVPRAVVR